MTDFSGAMSKVPNQTFNTNINGRSFSFRFRTFRGIMYASVSIDNSIVESGVVCVSNQGLFSSDIDRAAGGKFMFMCMEDLYPSYELLDGTTCKFVYVPSSEA